jgi:hypothetical protein
MKKMKQFVKDQDIFGQEISLNFDRKGNTYKTSFGGILTIIFYSLIAAVSAYGIINTLNHTKDTY